MTATPNRPTVVCRMGDYLVHQLSRLTTKNIYDQSSNDYAVIALVPHETSDAPPHALVWALPGTEVSVDDNVEGVVKQITEHFRYARGLAEMRYWSLWPQGCPDTQFHDFAAYEVSLGVDGPPSFGTMMGVVELAQAVGFPVAMLRAILPKQPREVNQPMLSLQAA